MYVENYFLHGDFVFSYILCVIKYFYNFLKIIYFSAVEVTFSIPNNSSHL